MVPALRNVAIARLSWLASAVGKPGAGKPVGDKPAGANPGTLRLKPKPATGDAAAGTVRKGGAGAARRRKAPRRYARRARGAGGDRESGVVGKKGAVRVDLGGRRTL